MNNIIVLEGLDGSGKETVSKALSEKFENSKIFKRVEIIHFPYYESETGKLISKVLSGNVLKLFTPDELPYGVIELFARNRYQFFKENKLENDVLYIFDRYMQSNIFYQTHGLSPYKINTIIEFMRYADYTKFGNPQPEFSVFIRVPYDILRKRLDSRKENKAGIETDTYESDNFLKTSYHISELLLNAQHVINFSLLFDFIVDTVNEETEEVMTPEQIANTIFKAYIVKTNKEQEQETEESVEDMLSDQIN